MSNDEQLLESVRVLRSQYEAILGQAKVQDEPGRLPPPPQVESPQPVDVTGDYMQTMKRRDEDSRRGMFTPSPAVPENQPLSWVDWLEAQVAKRDAIEASRNSDGRKMYGSK